MSKPNNASRAFNREGRIARVNPDELKKEITHESIEECTQEFLKKNKIKKLKDDATEHDSDSPFPSHIFY